MVKADIVSALCEKGYYKNQANDVVDEVLQIIRDALVRGEQVQLRGFGTFEVKTRKGRNSKNIQDSSTGKTCRRRGTLYDDRRSVKEPRTGEDTGREAWNDTGDQR